MANKVQIGWIVVPEDREFTNAGYSCAAWWETVAVKAGRYPAYVFDPKFRDDGQLDCQGVYGSLDGTVVADYFGSLYFGMPISAYDNKKNAGKRSAYNTFAYAYMVAEDILSIDRFNCGYRYELFPEYEAAIKTFTYDGEEHHLPIIRKKEA